MLNELAQVVDALDAVGIAGGARHQNIQPMGKNADVLVTLLNEDGRIQSVEVVRAEVGQHFLKFAPANNGPGFPGFSMPAPIRKLGADSADDLTVAIESFCALAKNKNTSPTAISDATNQGGSRRAGESRRSSVIPPGPAARRGFAER